MNTNQISAETARQIEDLDPNWCFKDDVRKVEGIIQAAIEKATEELREANDNLFKVARKHCVENSKLRAAHASEPWTDEDIQQWAWVCDDQPDDDGWATIRNRKADHIARMPYALAQDICRKQSAALVRAAEITHYNASMGAAHASERWRVGHDGMGMWGIYHGEETKKGWSGKGRLLVDSLSETQAKHIVAAYRAAHASEPWTVETAICHNCATIGKGDLCPTCNRHSLEMIPKPIRDAHNASMGADAAEAHRIKAEDTPA